VTRKVFLVLLALVLTLSAGLVACGAVGQEEEEEEEEEEHIGEQEEEEEEEQVAYDLIIDSTAGGSVTTPGEGTFRYEEGTAVDLVAEADEGYVFVNWAGDVGTVGDVNAASITIILNGDYSITAYFEEEEVELYYDDGSVDSAWATGPVGGGALLFTPPSSGYVLAKVKTMCMYDQDDAPFYIEVWDGESNELFRGTYLYSDYFSGTLEWAEIDIPDIVMEDDFYIGVFGNTDVNHRLLLGFDTDPPISGRSFAATYEPNVIEDVEEWNWMIRAVGHA
jgi:hypothetical protein